MSNKKKETYLVAYDYGSGGLWGVMRAHSRDQIKEIYPELEILSDRPSWMSDERWEELLADPYELDEEPRGLIRALLADRER